MAATYTYRPRKITVPQLVRIAKDHHTNLNRFIEEALLEKITREQEGDGRALADKVERVIIEHMGLHLTKPGKATASKIDKVVRKNHAAKSWISDENVRPERYRK
jgi:hypothetical protein